MANFKVKNGLDVNEHQIIDSNGNITVPNLGTAHVGSDIIYHAGNLTKEVIEALNITASGSNTLGGVADTSYLRSDVTDTFTNLNGTSITLGNSVTLSESSDRADLLSISSGTSGWGGLQVTNTSGEAIGSFMIDGNTIGLYDDINSDWILSYTENAGVTLLHNSINRIQTSAVGANIFGNLTISGNLDIQGTTTTINTATVTTSDNIIVLNNGEVGAGVTAGSAGIQIDRGTATDYQFIFDESTDSFKVGETTSLQKVATREDSPTAGRLAIWDSSTSKFVTNGNAAINGNLTITGTVDGRDIAADGASLDSIEAESRVLNTSNNNSDFLAGNSDASFSSYIMTTGIINTTETGTGPAGLIFGNGSTLGSDQISLVTNGQTKIYMSTTKIDLNADTNVAGNLAVTGTVDGRNVSADGAKLDGIEAGATADQTASEILTLLKTVDGGGSGLDADTIDGINSSNIMQSNYANGYYGLTSPTADSNNWIRTTTNGLLPYASGGSGSLGTASWPFSNIYANNIYDNGTLLESKFAAINGSLAQNFSANTLTADAGLNVTAGDVTIGTGASTNSWLTLDGADGSTERTGISIGESGKHGSASLHIYYTGDGVSHFGMGAMSASTHAANRAFSLHYTSPNTTFYGNLVLQAGKTVDGRDVSADGAKLDGIASGANNYSHPTYTGDDINLDTGPLTGATVISDLDFNVTTDTSGHVTDANAVYATRNLTASNIGALPITGGTMTGNILVNNYGIGLVGLYSATKYQNIFSMGNSYKPSADGSSLSNMYGIAYTHTNIGGQSKPGLSHQALFVEAGITKTAIGNGIWTSGTVTAPTFVGALTGNAATATWADTVDVNASDTGANDYNVVWHSGDVVYSSNHFKINRDQQKMTLNNAKVKTNLELGSSSEATIKYNSTDNSIDFIIN